jgi:hypothetical protein
LSILTTVVVLSGRYLNTDLKGLAAKVGAYRGRSPRPPSHDSGWPDGRRPFGSVSTLVLDVLAAAGHEMSAQQIGPVLKELTGETISLNSIGDFLRTDSKRPRARVIRTARGFYRLST